MSSRFSRRTVTGAALGGLGVAALGPSGAMAQTPAASPLALDFVPGEIVIPDSAVELPTDDITFRWIDSGDLKALFYTELQAAYTAKHPNIQIEYDALPWTEIAQIVPLGVQNGEAHDFFAIPPEIPVAQAVAEGWVAPLDDIIPNFAEFKARFPLGAFIDGVHVFDGLTYTFPQNSSKRYWTMTFYNTDIMEQAGYDLGTTRLTWDQYREAARKVTEQGAGSYYGVIIGAGSPGRLGDFTRNLARMAGASASAGAGFPDIDWRTGDYQYTSDQYRAAIELLLGLNADGSIFPGSTSLNDAQAWSQFPQGVAGMILEGPWVIPQWQRDAPDFRFGVNSQPLPNDGSMTPMTYEETGANQLWVYSGSEYKTVAGDILAYIGSLQGQVAVMAATRGNLRAILPEAVEIATANVELDPIASTALALYDEQLRLGPMVTVRNPEVAKVVTEYRPPSPNLGELVQGMLVGQVSDIEAALEDLQSRANAELDRAIEAAASKGANVSRDDFVFADWDPTQDYTADKYPSA